MKVLPCPVSCVLCRVLLILTLLLEVATVSTVCWHLYVNFAKLCAFLLTIGILQLLFLDGDRDRNRERVRDGHVQRSMAAAVAQPFCLLCTPFDWMRIRIRILVHIHIRILGVTKRLGINTFGFFASDFGSFGAVY